MFSNEVTFSPKEEIAVLYFWIIMASDNFIYIRSVVQVIVLHATVYTFIIISITDTPTSTRDVG